MILKQSLKIKMQNVEIIATLVIQQQKEFENNWPNYDFAWVWPAPTVYDIMMKTTEGILRRYKPMELVNYVTQGKLPEQQELNQIDQEVGIEIPF